VTAPYIQFNSDLYLIPLAQDLPGFDAFINAWLVTGNRNYLIDPGPSVTIKKLVSILHSLDIHHLDAILLTHIHIDHSGGIGDFSKWFPDTPVVCHAIAVDHLADPARLWAGSLKILGETARAYGPISPVPRARVVAAQAFSDPDIEIVLTPGHAVHHVSYLLNGNLFAGEAGGVYRELPGGYYLRPATPPKFYLETSLASITALEQIDCRRMCFGHYGMTEKPGELLKAHRKQLQWWAGEIEKLTSNSENTDLVKHCLDTLLKKDPLLAGWKDFTPSERRRELQFMANSVRGFLGYLKELSS
jgi:glyoxylase-like metal-dependent hydrolase (beta-lactamase superfamily II)